MNSSVYPPNKNSHGLKKYPHRHYSPSHGPPPPSKTFWRKHCIVVAIDACEIFDRIFCECGLVNTFQEAYTLTALDKRSFAPPIESQWQRVVNMANACESFKIPPVTVVNLIEQGFRSVTLLSMAKINLLKKDGMDQKCLKQCLGVLNDRRFTALEPLHSLRRLAHAKRKHLYSSKRWEFLDLANADFSRLPPNRDYKQPQPMIAKSTFKTTDTRLIFGPAKACLCSKKPRKFLSSTSSSTSSGYTSGYSSSLEQSPDSPDSVKQYISPFQAPPAHSAAASKPREQYRRPSLTRQGNAYPPPTYPVKDSRAYCPRPDCSWRLYLHQVEDHCSKVHQISTANGATAFTYTAHYDDSQSCKKFCGNVRLSLNAREVLNDGNVELWWGPKPFSFDKVTFYQMVYKKFDINRTREQEPLVLFWIQAKLPSSEASKYRYEVHLDHLEATRPQQRHYSGYVHSLEVSSSDMIKKCLRSVVYFPQSYLRKTLRFTHNHHTQPPPQRTDIKYTVKIMRQS